MMAELWTMSTVPGAFWFSDQELTLKDLTPDLADYYLYDLRRGAGDWLPKARLAVVPRGPDDGCQVERGQEPHGRAAGRHHVPGRARTGGARLAPGRHAAAYRRGRPRGTAAHPRRALRCSGRGGQPRHHYTMLVDPHAPEVARAIDRFVSAPSSRSRS